MPDQHRFGHVCFALLVSLAFAAFAPAHAQDHPSADNPQEGAKSLPHPLRKDRVFVWDLQGTWISKAYMDRLKVSRSPHATARRTPALMVKIDKQERSFPILVTNFQDAALQYLIEVEPDVKPNFYRMVAAAEDGVVNASDVTYIYFSGVRNADGKFDTLSIADPHFAKRKFHPFVRLPEPLDAVVNRMAIAGKYTDAQGRGYEFTEEGDAILPERRFVYEVSLDPRSADCEILQSHREREAQGQNRLGFAWAGGQLQLFNVKNVKKDRYACEGKPFAVLTPAG
jgi:hypothetical protein